MNEQTINTLIGAAGGIIAALGLGKVIPALINWWEEKRDERKKSKSIKYQEIKALTERIENLEKELDRHRVFETKTKTAFNSMIPLMKEMMKNHPDYIKLLEQLQENIFGGDLTSADGNTE